MHQGLDTRTGIAAGQAPGTQREANRPVRSQRARVIKGQQRERGHACNRGHERGGQRGRSDHRCPLARPDQDRRQDRAAAYPVNPAGTAHHDSQDHQHRNGNHPGRSSGYARGRWAGQRQPAAQRDQDHRGHHIKNVLAGEQFHPDDRPGDDTRQRPGDEHQGQAPARLPLPPVAVQRTRSRDHVVQQVRRRDGQARRPQHPGLKRRQQHRTRNTRGSRHQRDDISRRQGHDRRPASPQHKATLTSP